MAGTIVANLRISQAKLTARAGAGTIVPGQVYTIVDDGRLAVGLTTNTFQIFEKKSDSAIPLVIDGGGVVIATGTKFAFSVPFACAIVGYDLFGDQTGSIVVDLKKATYANYPTTASITAAAKPTLATARKATSTTLTGWTTAVAAGDVIEVVVDSAATLLVATLVLKVRKT